MYTIGMAAQRILEAEAWHHPLTEMHGVLRVGGTRLTLDLLVHAYQDGLTAEEIHIQYPSVSLSDIYSTILLYINCKTDVDAYLASRECERREAEVEIRKRYGKPNLRERLLGRKGERG